MSGEIKDLLTDSDEGKACNRWDDNIVWKGVKINSVFCTNVCKYHKECEIIINQQKE
jgi:hypothetical protein